MKKKILFTMESLGIGGAEKSLVTLLTQIDYNKYDVDLLLINPSGDFGELLPDKVNIKKMSDLYMNFEKSPIKSLYFYMKKGKIKEFMYNLMFLINLIYHRYILKKEYIGWKYREKLIDDIEGKYDLAVGFLEKKSSYITAYKTSANKKVGWVHIDYNNIEINYEIEKKCFDNLDYLATVSNHCKDVLMELFPEIEKKIIVIHNIISPKLIKKMALESCEIKKDDDEIIIVTVCRLTRQKGIDIAIEACSDIVKKGHKIKWIVVGDGEERSKLETLIKFYKLEDNFILTGKTANPYPYIYNSDIYIQPSRWEGFGITVAEAKVLNKPIIASSIEEFKEQLINNYNGLLFDNKDELINYIIELIGNDTLRKKISGNLVKEKMDNSTEVLKLLRLIE